MIRQTVCILILVLCAIIYSTPLSWARQYNFKNTSFSIAFSGGLTTLKTKDFIQTSLPQGYSASVPAFSYGGLFGLEIGVPIEDRFQFSVGADYILPGLRKHSGTGTDDVGRSFNVVSRMSSLIPRLTADFFPLYFSSFRVYFGLSYGLAYHSVKNEYAFNDSARASGFSDFTEYGKTSAAYIEAHGALEFFFADNWAIGLKTGYQTTKSDNFKLQADSWNFNVPLTTGARLINSDGSFRMIDLSGMFALVTMRLLY